MNGFLRKSHFQRDKLCLLESLSIKHIKFKMRGSRTSSKKENRIESQIRDEESLHRTWNQDLWWDGRRLCPRAADLCWPPLHLHRRGGCRIVVKHDSLGEKMHFHSRNVQIIISSYKKSCWPFTSVFNASSVFSPVLYGVAALKWGELSFSQQLSISPYTTQAS